MTLRIFLILILFSLTSCGQAGWVGYYTERGAADKYININTGNSRVLNEFKKQEVWLEMPMECSTFIVSGIITPITPPIPFFWLRSWAGNDCWYFTISTRPKTKATLKVGDKILEPEMREGRWGYTNYIFPIRAKNLDSGTIILEKDGQKVEVPFEYKYFKFWY